ncbi:MAG: helix-turn-helix domain-containing protein [Firmicutes bacterium]|nr:helix-turn-helix domain-containing protein [Bacillota bacterium]
MLEKYYKAKDVLVLFNISMSTLDRLCKAGKLKPVYVGSHRRFAESALQKYVEQLEQRGDKSK